MIGFDPIVGPEPRVLVLGTAPSERSLREGRYYAHPRNDFWPIMERLFADGRPLEYTDRVQMLKDAGVGLWDVLTAAERVGSLDATITAPVANDLGGFLQDHPSIGTVFFNGATAERLFQAHCASGLARSDMRFVRLPSTSPAHASVSFTLKLAAWQAVRAAAGEGQAPPSNAAPAPRPLPD